MNKADNSISISSVAVVLSVLLSAGVVSAAAAEGNYGNLPPDPNMMGMIARASVELPFDPDDYSFLIYVPWGSQDNIREAMEHLGIPYDVRDPNNEVTANDLMTHDILIVGWNLAGDTSGLDTDILAAGITGRVILSGHDADFHIVEGPTQKIQQTAEVFLVQAIDYVLAGGGTGMITLGCTARFPYLPEGWNVSAEAAGGEDVDEFTDEGLVALHRIA